MGCNNIGMFNLPKPKTSNWDRVAYDYEDLIKDTGDYNHKTYINPVIMEILGEAKNKKILDLACGQGYFSKILADEGAKVTGVDISEKLIEIAKQKYNKSNLNFLIRDGSNLEGIENDSFDIVIINMALHDIRHPAETLEELTRVIKTSGRLIFSIPHPWTHTGKGVKEGRNYYLRLENYKKQMEIPNKLYGKEGIVSFHRPLEYYINLLTKHKFEITHFREVCKERGSGTRTEDPDYIDFKREFPSFLIVGAIKRLDIKY